MGPSGFVGEWLGLSWCHWLASAFCAFAYQYNSLDQIASGLGDGHKSELGHMYYTNLNLGADLSPNRGTVQIPGVDHGVILNFSSELFWTQDTYTPKPSRAWALWTSFPLQARKPTWEKFFTAELGPCMTVTHLALCLGRRRRWMSLPPFGC